MIEIPEIESKVIKDFLAEKGMSREEMTEELQLYQKIIEENKQK